MPVAVVDGIATRYEVTGSGPPLLMFSPGGFNATVENWTSFGIYGRLDLLRNLSEHYMCITFDKRESGQSGGRLEPITWNDYAAQGAGLLDHLGVERAHVLGGCIGCSIAVALAIPHPGRVASMVLYSPAGGPKYRRTQRRRFEEHIAFVAEHGLEQVVGLARATDASFAEDPRVGPWATVIRLDASFAAAYAESDAARYCDWVGEMARTLFDRDTVPGPAADELMRLEIPALVVPGNDQSHALSAAHYLHECLSHSELWDVMPEEQSAENAPRRVLTFLQSNDSPRSSAAI